MSRIATRPLSPSAVQKANARTAEAFPTTPAPGDANYGDFQKTWMDAYVAAGGKAEPQSSASQSAAAQSARAETSTMTGTMEVCKPCQAAKEAKMHEGQAGEAGEAPAEGSQGQPAPEAPPVVTATENRKIAPKPTPCTCVLTGLDVQCSHGRKAKDGLLQVVSRSIFAGDAVTISPQASGGDCGSKLEMSLRGFGGGGPTSVTGPAPQKRDTKPPMALQKDESIIPSFELSRLMAMSRASPTVATVDANACGGNTQLVTVERFPSGKCQAKIGIEDIVRGFADGFKNMPIDARGFTKKGTVRKIARKGEGKSSSFQSRWQHREKTSKGWDDASFGISLGCEWKEDDDTAGQKHLAYCEMYIWGGYDPLFETGFSMLVYGVPIPPKLDRYIRAGIYLNFSGKIVAGGRGQARRYPSLEPKLQQKELIGELSGALTVELAAELFVLSPKVASAKAGGSASIEAKGALTFKGSGSVTVKPEILLGKCAASVSVKMLWGLVETEREWPIYEGYSVPLKEHEILSLG